MTTNLQVKGAPSVFRGSFMQYEQEGGDLHQLAEAFQRVFNGHDWRYGLPIDNYRRNIDVFFRLNADLYVHYVDGEVVAMGVGYSFDDYPPDADFVTYPSREALLGAGAPEEGGYFIDVVLVVEEHRKTGLAYQAYEYLAQCAADHGRTSIVSWTEVAVWESKKNYFTRTGRSVRGEFDPPGLPDRAVVLVGPVGKKSKVEE